MKFLTSVDMSHNEILNFVIHPSAEAPVAPVVGQLYTDISGAIPKLMIWDGKKWSPLGSVVPEKSPTKVDPSVIIYVSDIDTSDMEVGMTVPITYKAEFNPGSYSYGPETGVTVESWRVYDTEGHSSTSSEGTFDDVTIGDNTTYKLTVEATHTAGAIPVTDQGTEYPSVQIQAGTKSASTGALSGIRKYFYGTFTEIEELTSDRIRSLTHSTNAVGTGASFELPIPAGTNQVVIAFPSNSGLELYSVIDTGAFNMEVYDIFVKSVVAVEGANGYDAIDYDVYAYTPAVSLSRNKYNVTIS